MAAPTNRPGTRVDRNILRTIYDEPGKYGCKKIRVDNVDYFLRLQKPAGAILRPLFLENITIYDESTFPGAPDGVYTWLLSDRGFFALPVTSMLEVGSLHMHAANRSNSNTIYLAGECLKHSNHVDYNTYSGTYTLKIVESGAAKNTDLRRAAGELFARMGLTATDTQDSIKTYITDVYLPITREVLEGYKRLGYNVKLYREKRFCDPMALAILESQLSQKNAMIGRFPGIASLEAERDALAAQIAEITAGAANARMLGGATRRRKQPRRRQTRRRA